MYSMVGLCLFLTFSSLVFTIATTHDPVSNQLQDYNLSHSELSLIQTGYGSPVSDILTSLTVGPRGPMLLQDVVFLDTMSSFTRERIPERVVHGKGSGAFGYFEVTKDITKYCKAKVFSSVGKTTKIAVRFSLAVGERGSAETVRDDHGFAVKFYTEEGIWDLVGYDTPVFLVRDAMAFPLAMHSFQRNPVTNVKDPDMAYDMMTLMPETVYHLMMIYADEGLPDGYRHMNGFGQHAFKMVNAEGKAVYVKFHYLTDQSVKTLSREKAAELASSNPDYATRDLFNAIANGDYPWWTLYIQVMTFEEAEKFRWNPFDITKIWPEDEYPLMEVGRFVLNKNPTNYFTDVEQIAFSPANMPPGIEPSPDKILQGRLFAYSDAQRYRLGSNHLELPVNCPFKQGVTNYQRDGLMRFQNPGGAPTYFPNSFNGPTNDPRGATSSFSVTGDVNRYNSNDDDNYSQPAMYWNGLSPDHQNRILANIVRDLKRAKPVIQDRAIAMFSRVNVTMGDNLRKGLQLA